uniref:Uncharacterized protein n=1 Tax=Arundo donax TaxID=35708 RepID=A0A0A9EGP8_ARUDO
MLFPLEAFTGQVLCGCAPPLHALCYMRWGLGGISYCFLNQQVLWHLSLHGNSFLGCIYHYKLLFGLF